MKRTWILSGVFLVLIVIMLVLVSNREDGDSSFEEYEGNFKISNVDEVGRIFIANRDGSTVDLKRKADHWTVNDSFIARQTMINTLLETVSKLEIRYIPARAAIPNITKTLAVYGIKVEIYTRQGSELKTYYVGGATQDERGTFMIKEGSEQPFAIHLPTMDGGLRARFEPRVRDWRDRHFLQIKPEEIEMVKVNYPRRRHASFVLKRNGSSYEISALYPDTPEKSGEFRKAAADNFMRDLTNVACESFENDYPKKDSIRALLPWSEYQLTLRGGDSIGFSLYPCGPLIESEFSPSVHRFFIDCNTGDFMLGQYSVLEDILRGYEYFILGR